MWNVQETIDRPAFVWLWQKQRAQAVSPEAQRVKAISDMAVALPCTDLMGRLFLKKEFRCVAQVGTQFNTQPRKQGPSLISSLLVVLVLKFCDD